MERILNQHHNLNSFTYVFSRLFERAAYYGLRTLIILYLTGVSFKMSTDEVFVFYSWFTTALIFSGVIGAVLGDLVIGNKKAMILGGVLQTIGAFALCLPTHIALYIGLGLVVLGGGLYTSNLISSFGKSYLNRHKLLDSAFLIKYFAVNLGSFIGVLSIGYIGETYNYNYGFFWQAF